ncbi:MAG: ATP-binding protein [Treponema sp.]|jgi:predicted AAA+ superfamily ATPase|nr:ATP-binding protein [Treponema sp.]
MRFIERNIILKIKDIASKFPVVFLTGPRQSGKSTLLKTMYPDYTYINLEEKDIRDFAHSDPRSFLASYGDRVIIDEAQRAPDLFSYLQTRVDEKDRPGMYILSGSQNFLMLRNISQSLAGRVGILSLLPFSLNELAKARRLPKTVNEWMFNGAYPRLVCAEIDAPDFYSGYIATYVERDIRQEVKVHDLDKFRRFLGICAASVGSPINLSKTGAQVSADARTINSWLSILEESYIIFRLAPYHRSMGTRFIKTQKLYFYDTGLLCALLGFSSADELALHPMRGHIFESAVISEIVKNRCNTGKTPRLYYWRDSDNREKEIDLIEENLQELVLSEIKSSQTANRDYIKNLLKFDIEGKKCTKQVIYDGNDGPVLSGVRFINWKSFADEAIFPPSNQRGPKKLKKRKTPREKEVRKPGGLPDVTSAEKQDD